MGRKSPCGGLEVNHDRLELAGDEQEVVEPEVAVDDRGGALPGGEPPIEHADELFEQINQLRVEPVAVALDEAREEALDHRRGEGI